MLFSSIEDRSTSPPQTTDPFTDRLDKVSLNQKHQGVEIESLREKLREATSRIDSVSAVALRQKDQEVAELRQQVEIHKETLAEFRRKQEYTDNILLDLQTRIDQLEGVGGVVDGEEAPTTVKKGFNAMRGEMIAMEERIDAEFIRKENLEGLAGHLERAINAFVDDVNKQMRESIQKRVELNRAADVEKRQVNERLARLEVASFELLTAAFAQVKFERGEYEEELGKRRQEAHRMLIPSQINRPISTLPPARKTPNLAGPIEAENPPTSTRNIAPLPQRKEISTGQSSANGKFEGWGGFNPKDPTAVVEDHLLKEFDGVETAVTSAINVLLSGTHGELPDKIADVSDDGVPMGTHQQESSAENHGDKSSPVATASKAAEGLFAHSPIILGDSSEKAAESAKGTSD